LSTSTAGRRTDVVVGPHRGPFASSLRAYFLSDSARKGQTLLGLVWLLDAGLQFQSFMYSKGFIQMLTGMTAGQPGWLADSMKWAAKTAGGNLTVWNTLFALAQCAIALGILYRPTVKPALALSFVWVIYVWWFGEAFGMLFMNMSMPLTGAPGAVLLYGLIGLIVWPNGRPGGLVGVRGARTIWAALWSLMAWLWLMAPSSSANAVHNAINAAPSGMSWLSSLQDGFASAAKGNGLVIAMVLAAASLAIALAVARNWRAKELLALAAALNLVYWLVGQGFGGIPAGGATDPNAGLLFILFAYVMYTLVPYEQGLASPTRGDLNSLGDT
jgi:hypothetical protein